MPTIASNPMTIRQQLRSRDHIKVKLLYRCEQPQSGASIMLKNQLKVKGPYLEEVCVLIPMKRAFTLLEAYIDFFEQLRDAELVPADAELHQYQFLPQGDKTLAYLLN